MRIISKFRDFYDVVQKTGMDREVVYLRETKDIVLKGQFKIGFSTKGSTRFSISGRNGSYTISTMFLGYCGIIYKIYTVTGDLGKNVFHDYEGFKNYMLDTNLGSRYEFNDNRFWPSRYQEFRDFDTNKMNDIFHQFQTPLFLLNHERDSRGPGETTITLGPCLKDLEFQKIKDPYTAYQEIFQFVAGTLNKPENKMVKISDKDKIAKHGYDKWSFRQKGPKK